VQGRRIGVISAPGDRRDEDIREIAAKAAGTFDHYICRRDDQLRGRGSDEVPRMLSEALIEHGVDADQMEVIPEEEQAVDAALRLAEPGDLVVLFGDALRRTWNQIVNFQANGEGEISHSDTAAPAVPVQLPEVPEYVYDTGQSIVRDERGVRLAREQED
jgi:cyanophycin synthetase